jgi:hypothetical protein
MSTKILRLLNVSMDHSCGRLQPETAARVLLTQKRPHQPPLLPCDRLRRPSLLALEFPNAPPVVPDLCRHNSPFFAARAHRIRVDRKIRTREIGHKLLYAFKISADPSPIELWDPHPRTFFEEPSRTQSPSRRTLEVPFRVCAALRVRAAECLRSVPHINPRKWRTSYQGSVPLNVCWFLSALG